MACRFCLLVLAATLAAVLPLSGQGQPPAGPQQFPSQKQVTTPSDFFDDPLPKGAIARLGSWRLRHDSEIKSVAITADGKTIASLADDGVRVWRAETGEQIGCILHPTDDHSSLAYAMALSPANKILAIAHRYGKGISLWDLPVGKELGLISWKSPDFAHVVAISHDGTVVAADSGDGKINSVDDFTKIWDRATLKERTRLPPIGEHIRGLALSPDGKLIAVADVTAVTVFNLASAKALYKIESAGAIAGPSLTFSPDGAYLIYSARIAEPWNFDENLHVHHTKDGSTVNTDVRPGGRVAFDGLGKTMVVVNPKAGIAVYAGAAGPRIKTLDFGPSQCVALDSAGRTLVLTDRNRIHVWDLNRNVEKPLFLGHRRPITSLNFTGDGKRVVSQAKDSPEVLLWDVDSGKAVARIQHAFTRPFREYYKVHPESWQDERGNGIPTLGFSVETGILATGNSQLAVAQLWSARDGRFLKQLKATPREPPESIHYFPQVAFSANGKLLAATDLHRMMSVWDAVGFKELWRAEEQRKGATDHVTGVALSPNAEALAVAFSDGGGRRFRAEEELAASTLSLREASTGKLLREVPTDGVGVWPIVFSPDSKILAGVRARPRGAVVLWNVETGAQLAVVDQHEDFPWQIGIPSFSPDGRLMTALSIGRKRNYVDIWEVDTSKLVGELPITGSPVVFSPRGTTLALPETEQSVLIVDLVGALLGGKQAVGEAGLEQAWSTLKSADASGAYQAMAALSRNGSSASLLAKKLDPVPRPEAAKIEELIAQLDADRAQTREKASTNLIAIGDDAVPFLKKALEANPPLEVRQRIPLLMKTLEKRGREYRAPSDDKELQQIRSIQVLLWIGNADAVALLTRLAEGASAARQTQDARTALKILRPFSN